MNKQSKEDFATVLLAGVIAATIFGIVAVRDDVVGILMLIGFLVFLIGVYSFGNWEYEKI